MHQQSRLATNDYKSVRPQYIRSGAAMEIMSSTRSASPGSQARKKGGAERRCPVGKLRCISRQDPCRCRYCNLMSEDSREIKPRRRRARWIFISRLCHSYNFMRGSLGQRPSCICMVCSISLFTSRHTRSYGIRLHVDSPQYIDAEELYGKLDRQARCKYKRTVVF